MKMRERPVWYQDKEPNKYSNMHEFRNEVINYFVEFFETRIKGKDITTEQKKWLKEFYYGHLTAHHCALYGHLKYIDETYGNFQGRSGYNVLLNLYNTVKKYDQYYRDLECRLFIPPNDNPNEEMLQVTLETFHQRFMI